MPHKKKSKSRGSGAVPIQNAISGPAPMQEAKTPATHVAAISPVNMSFGNECNNQSNILSDIEESGAPH
ncbi:hypothetical protein HDU76_007437, partial [Blyttiomyces sp. JEL0837]